jgi:hypothetical protein
MLNKNRQESEDSETSSGNAKQTFSSYIKDIWLEVPNYEFEHQPIVEDTNGKWVGRDEISKKLESYLSDGDSGAYLITGYRGMGKTSFVKRIVDRYRKLERGNKSVRQITVSFGQKDIKELDVLRQMIKGMMDKILPHYRITHFLHKKIFNIKSLPVWTAAIFLLIVLCDGKPTLSHREIAKEKESVQKELAFKNIENSSGKHDLPQLGNSINLVMEWDDKKQLWYKLQSPHGLEIGGALLILSLLIAFILQSSFIFIFRKTVPSTGFYDRLEELYERCRSQITKEDGGFSVGEKLPFGLSDRLVKKFPLANPKEMENEIIDILDDYGRIEKGVKKHLRFLKWKSITLVILIGMILCLPLWIQYRFGVIQLLATQFSQFSWSIVAWITTILSLASTLLVYQAFTTKEKTKKMLALMAFSFSITGLVFFITVINKQGKIPELTKMWKVDVIFFSILAVTFLISLLIVIGIFFKKWDAVVIGFTRRKFIFIFDEIDKIDPSPDKGKYHEELDKLEKKGNDSNVTDLRERRQIVINILANLKYLITTAKAKFIFIAGREMFDAALADIADRQSAVSSIFHQVINVDSFLKDESKIAGTILDRKTAGLSMLVEEYLERILLPREENITNKNESFVKRYYTFLDHHKNSEENEHAIRKVIFTLQSMIVYLTYRSNGSPKKLVRLIEDMIKPVGDNKLELDKTGFYETDKTIFLDLSEPYKKQIKTKNYIHIGYKNQYKFGFINYIFRPFLSTHGNQYKTYSDKILVSTPYLLDHIIKFHAFAFSLQNLELVPEVLSESRSPELRSFIEDLVTYLGQSHLRDTEVGVFDYKFLHKTFHEIEYLCKIFEDESAAFNFTLDETYHVKLHIRNKIKELRSIYKEFIPIEQHIVHINSLSFLNEMLGNSQFFDQEFDEAIISYHDALQGLETIIAKPGVFSFEVLVNYINLKLKLGLTLEKMKNYDSALAVYGETFTKANEYILYGTKSINNSSALGKTVRHKSLTGREDYLQIIIQPLIASLYLQEKMDVEGAYPERIAGMEELIHRLGNIIFQSRESQKYLLNASFSSSLGTLLFYKNASDQNSGISTKLNGTNYEDLSIKEFRAFTNYGKIQRSKESGDERWRDFRSSASTYKHLKHSLACLLKYNDAEIGIDEYDHQTYSNLIRLLQIAEDLTSGFINTDLQNPNVTISHTAKHDKRYLKNVAVAIYKLADCLYSNIKSKSNCLYIRRGNYFFAKSTTGQLNSKSITGWSFYSFDASKFKKCFLSDTESGGLSIRETELDAFLFQLTMCMYYWSGQMLMRIGKNLTCSFMYRKIIQSFRLIVTPSTAKDYCPLIESYFLMHVIQISGWNSNASDRYQVKKYEYNFSSKNNFDNKKHKLDKYNLLSTSGSAEVREGLILYSELKIKTLNKSSSSTVCELRKISSLLTQYNTVPTQHIRYHELRLRVELNKKKFECQTGLNFNGENGIIADVLNRLQKQNFHDDRQWRNRCKEEFQLIANSIFCLHQIIAIYNGYGINYFMSYLSLGKYHERLGDWLCFYKLLSTYCDKTTALEKHITKELEKLLSPDTVRILDYESEYQLALQHYSRAKQLHNEGGPYHNQTVNMYYLEDDFNDSLYHYGIAVERQRINSGSMRDDIKRLQKIIDHNEIFRFDYYTN